tara:strand:- start:86 stop:382 length:297 start_codon:yes stop_codon:yes gene_type:complete
MRDYWNDPPETPEPPECCGEEMEIDDQGNCKCLKCGHTIRQEVMEEQPEDLEPFPPEDWKPAQPEKCPHGNDWGECGACDHASDIAFDTQRERRLFGR